jgi:glycosyltransferase involved in cell wall biosynthesis
MTKLRQYVTAFPGRRDSYQVPAALAESGRLARFVTCFYAGSGLTGRVANAAWRRRHRHSPLVPSELVSCREMSNATARLLQRVIQPSRVAVWEDLVYARAAVSEARKRNASLLLYEFQAEWAFSQRLPGAPVRILFQFHPHPGLEHPLLLEDAERYPEFREDVLRNTRRNLGPYYSEHTTRAWRQADHVIVASGFTARSLVAAGCPPERITIVPYGCSFTPSASAGTGDQRHGDKPFFLFVGSGSQRKGLHHLLEAWRDCDARTTHDLVVVARVVDRQIAAALETTPAVRHLRGVSAVELQRLFRTAKAFVMPSMAEGFGHVYLEALLSGCPVIGTRNTMLPDCAEAQPHIRYVTPGNIQEIRSTLDEVGRLNPSAPFFATDGLDRLRALYDWSGFRAGVEQVLARFD